MVVKIAVYQANPPRALMLNLNPWLLVGNVKTTVHRHSTFLLQMITVFHRDKHGGGVDLKLPLEPAPPQSIKEISFK